MKTTLFFFAALICAATSSAQNTWQAKANLPTPARMAAAGFSIGGKGYVGTGYNGAVGLDDFWEWDQATNTWTQKANLPGGTRGWATAFSIGNKGFLGTGYDPGTNTYFSDFWEYDPAANVWTTLAPLPYAGDQAISFSIGGKGYVGTGYIGGGNRTDLFYEYDTTTNAWTQKAYFLGWIRSNAVAFSIGSKGYVGTGRDAGTCYYDFYEYDPATDTWSVKADFPGGLRLSATGFSIGGKGYVGAGGDYPNANNLYHDFWEYDPVADAWTQRADIPNPRSLAVGFSINGKGYVSTGYAGPGNDLQEYSPVIAGIHEWDISSSVKIYPNPFTTTATISFSQSLDHATFSLYDVSGKKLRDESFTGNRFILERQSLAAGIYIYRVSSNEGTASGRLEIR